MNSDYLIIRITERLHNIMASELSLYVFVEGFKILAVAMAKSEDEAVEKAVNDNLEREQCRAGYFGVTEDYGKEILKRIKSAGFNVYPLDQPRPFGFCPGYSE